VREKLGEVPREQSFNFEGPDVSLAREWEAFAGVVINGDKVESDGLDAFRTLLLAEGIYRAGGGSGSSLERDDCTEVNWQGGGWSGLQHVAPG
jgi:predicted dehydrogenase